MHSKTENDAFTKIETQIPFSLGLHSSIGCGGYAKAGFYPKTEEELVWLIEYLVGIGERYVVVGNMTNVLPSDEFLDKTVVCTKKCDEVRFTTDGAYVSAGISAGRFLAACEKNEKTGAEFLDGIPCTLGGALYMNAGVSGKYIAEIVQYVRVLYRGKIIELSLADCQYAYKTSVFMQKEYVILGARLRLDKASVGEIQQKRALYMQRRLHLPKAKSMGCVFKNPSGLIAGKLIEGAGLKGLRIGGAKVSQEHANFIINDNHATANDIKKLIDVIKKAVRSQYGVELQEEIRYLY